MYQRLKRIRGGSGLGDALYVQAVARHLVNQGKKLQICTDWPDVFLPLADKVEFDAFSRSNIDYLAHYSKRKEENTTQFEDCCIESGLNPDEVEYKLDWRDRPQPKPYVLVHTPRTPMDRKDKFGAELLPDCSVIDDVLDQIGLPVIQVGSGVKKYHLQNVDQDLHGKTTVKELFDLAKYADYIVGQVSFIIPLAESLDKKLMVVWSSKGMLSDEKYVARITPRKILHKPTSHYVIDDWNIDKIHAATDTLCQL